MLQAIRDRATGWIAYGIVGFLIIPFAFWGIDQYQGGGQTNVAEVAGVKISHTEFQRAFQNEQSRLQSMFGGNLDPDMVDNLGIRRQVLNRLIDQQVLTATSREVGLTVSDVSLGLAIHEIQAFQTNGSFDPARYRQLLSSQGYTPESFEAQMRIDIANQQLQEGVVGSFAATPADISMLLRLRDQKRDIETMRLSLAVARETVEIGGDELEDWFSANGARFQVAERAKVRYLELDAATLGAEGAVSDEDLRVVYEEQKGRFMRPEEREGSYVLLPVDGEADEADQLAAEAQMVELRERLISGDLTLEQLREDPADAGYPEVDVGELGVVVEGVLDADAERALMAATEVGQFSDLVRNDFGFQVLRLDALRPTEGREFAEVRDELEVELRQERGENLYYELADELATLSYENPGSLEPAAEALGLSVQESDWVSRDGGDGVWSNPEVREEMFSADVLDQGLNSQAVELDDSHVVVLRLLDHEPARAQGLDEVRDAALAALRDVRATEELSAMAAEVVEAVRDGASLEAEAERTGATWQGTRSVTRTDSELDAALREAVFALPHPSEQRPSVTDVQLGAGDRIVVVLSRVEYDDSEELDAAERDALRAALSQQYGQSEFGAVVTELRDRTEVEVYEDQL